MDRQRTCKQRVRAHCKSRLADLRRMLKAMASDNDNKRDAAFEEFSEYGLCFDYVEAGTEYNPDKEGYFRYQISYGGPSDEFRFFTGPDFRPYKIEYWFLDWFDGASIELSGEGFDLLERVFDDFKDCGTVENVYQEAIKA